MDRLLVAALILFVSSVSFAKTSSDDDVAATETVTLKIEGQEKKVVMKKQEVAGLFDYLSYIFRRNRAGFQRYRNPEQWHGKTLDLSAAELEGYLKDGHPSDATKAQLGKILKDVSPAEAANAVPMKKADVETGGTAR